MMVFMGFVVGKVAMGQVSFTVLQFSSASYECSALIFHQGLAQYATLSPHM
jgi:hypothetical protein